MSQKVPAVDLAWQHQQIADDLAEPFASVMNRTAFILGPEVAIFERDFASYSDARHCVGVANGTDAVELALRAAGLQDGDEVIVPANTFVATASAVRRAGGRVVFADCDDEYFLIDPSSVEEVITERTRAVIPVHLYGQMAPMAAIHDIAARHELAVVEDAAQCQGATQAGHGPGFGSVCAATSFYPGKNLGAYGDAGAILTNDDAVALHLQRLRNHGGVAKYEHVEFGTNSRLDTLQAVVLSAKLGRLSEWNEMRRSAADLYGELLAGVTGVRLPTVAAGNVPVWHLYVVRVQRRDEVLESLLAAGIGAGIHYPQPVSQMPAYAGSRAFPVAESNAPTLLTLPMFPGITNAQQEMVADALRIAVS